MPTITNVSETTTITPELVLGYETQQLAATIIHEIIGRADPDVSLRPARSRSGDLKLFFLTESDAGAARTALEQPDVWEYASTELTTTDMSFVVSGPMDTKLDPDTRARWVLTLEYREVLS